MTPSTVTRRDPTEVELEFGLPHDELIQAREQAFRELSRNARIHGFRPGKVPRKVFESLYGTAQIEERALDKVLPAAYERAVRESEIDPVNSPRLEFLPADDSGDVRLRAVVAIRPAIALGEYRGIEVSETDASVPEGDVARNLESLRRSAAELVPVDRPVEPGDVATLDFVGTIDGVPFEGGSAENQATEISEERFIPGFATGVFGMRAGETKEITAQFPESYERSEFAGKTATFTVTVHDVKQPQYPELDDEFAARVLREGGTIDQLRTDVRDRLARTQEVRARRTMTGELLEKLRAMHDVALPEVMVEREMESLDGDMRRDVGRAGLTWDDYLKQSGRSEDDLRSETREEAQRRVKTSLLLDAIARAENIQATQADLGSELANLSAQYGRPPEEIEKMLRPNMPALAEGIARSKTVEFLLRHARHVEATPTPAA